MRLRTLNRLLALLACSALLLTVAAPATPALSSAPAAPVVLAAGAAPQFLRDMPDLQGKIGPGDSWTIGGGYLYWAQCNQVDTGGGYLRRWPLGGGRVATLKSGSFCGRAWAADASGLYYWASGAIYRLGLADSPAPVAVQETSEPQGALVLDGGTIYWIADGGIFSIPETATWDPDPRYNPPLGYIGDAGPGAYGLLASGDYLYWGPGPKRIAKSGGLGATATPLAGDAVAWLSGAAARYNLVTGSYSPLWVRGDSVYGGDTLRGYSCQFGAGGVSCGASTLYTAPLRGGSKESIGPMASDGRYLFWIDNYQSCGGLGCSLSTEGGQLMKWNLDRSVFQPNPFDTPQPIATRNSGGASYSIGGLGAVAVANGWVFFDTSNGLARIRADAPPISWNFAADSYEVTQGIQNLNNDVPLVAGKPTFVRFYGRKLDGPSAYGVEAILYGTRADGSALPGSPLRSINGGQDFTADNATPNRASTQGGWLFQLPAAWVAAGTIRLSPQIDPRQVWNEPDRSNNSLAYRAFSFARKAPICLVTIPVRTHAPAASNSDPSLFRMAEIARQIMPTSDVWLYHQDTDVAQLELNTDFPFIPPWKYEPYAVPAKGDNILRALWLRDALSDDPDRCDDAGAITHYVGLVHAQTPTSNNGGENLGKGYTPGAHLYVKLIDAAQLETTPQFWQAQRFGTLAHELSHNYGRQHVNCGGPANPDPNYPYRDSAGTSCVLDDGMRNGAGIPAYQRYYGFDTASLTPIDPGATADYMAYSSPFWVSDYTWRAVFGGVGGAAASLASAQPEPAAAGSVVYITGSVSASGATGRLEYAWVYPAGALSQGMRQKLLRSLAPRTADMAPQSAGPYSLRLRDAAGKLLDERAVVPQSAADGDGDVQTFALTFPAPAAPVARLELISGGAVIATLSPGGAAPAVSILSPSGGETIDSRMTLSWRATDPNAGDKLLFSVQYSPDNGQHWRALLADFPNRSGTDTVTLDLNGLSGLPGSTTGGLIRVAASDGYNTTIATSKPFSVANRAPEPHIDAPSAAPIPAGQPVIARGGATDAEDGGLDGTALRWALNGQDIGGGAQQTLAGLAPGSYTLALTARDSAGKTATASTTFTVAPLVIPLASAPALDGTCDDAAYASAARVALAPYSDGSQASVRLVRSADALWACFTGLKRTGGTSPGSQAGIRIDTTNGRASQPQPTDRLFFLSEDGTIKTYSGTGAGYVTPGPGGASGQVSANNSTWMAELRVDVSAIGGWGRVVGLDVETAWVNAVGDDYFWPYGARWDNPSTWATAALGDVPQLSGLAPSTAPAGTADTTLTVSGSGFVAGATVLWNGKPRPTTFVDSTRVRASIPAADLAAAGIARVAVANPGLQAAPSNALPFTITNPQPRIARLDLRDKTIGVSGARFVRGATVIWNGVARPTTFVSDGRLVAALDDADLLGAATTEVTVFNPGPGGGVSNIMTLRGAGTVYLPLARR